MSMRDRASALSALLSAALCISSAASAATGLGVEPPRFGTPISEADAAAWDISIPPDGTGLPEGRGTPSEGAAVYAAKCASCHGPNGEGGIAARLVGGFGTLAAPNPNPIRTVGSYWPYATTVFDVIRRTMPWDKPKTLSNEEVYAVTAHILNLNGIIPADAVLDKATLPQVRMPNRDGFIELYPDKF